MSNIKRNNNLCLQKLITFFLLSKNYKKKVSEKPYFKIKFT